MCLGQAAEPWSLTQDYHPLQTLGLVDSCTKICVRGHWIGQIWWDGWKRHNHRGAVGDTPPPPRVRQAGHRIC